MISSKSEILLTSAGPTTESIQQRLFDMSTAVMPASKLSRLRILRAEDGWKSFDRSSGVGLKDRVENRQEAAASRMWSNRYIRHVLGKADVTTVSLGDLDPSAAQAQLADTDLLLVPGGNTWQTMRGLEAHGELLKCAIDKGLPYVGESAGSIVAGLTLFPAMLPPADVAPATRSSFETGLGLVEFDVAVHAAGDESEFAIPGLLSKISENALKHYETPTGAIDVLAATYPIPLETLTNVQAISVSQGQIERL